MNDLLISNGEVLTVSSTGDVSVRHQHDVAVDGNRITSVKPHDATSAERARQVIDATGLVVMPGLINCHSHVPMVLFRGLAEDVPLERWFNDFIWPLESNLQEEDVYWGMLLGLVEMIETGVTCVADHYFHMDRAAKAVSEAGTRAVLSWVVFGSQGEAMLDRSAQFASDWQGAAGGRITTMLAPHAPYTCDDAFLAANAERARQLDIGIHIHVSETVEQAQASIKRRGISPIQVLEETGVLSRPTILAHALGATTGDIELLASRPCGIAHCPKTYLKLAMGTAPVVAFRRAGVAVGLGTDGAVSNNTLDVWESMRLMALTQKQAHGAAGVLPIPEVLHIATRESAKVVGMEGKIGAIEPDYLADIILVDTSAAHMQPLHSITAGLVYASRAGDVRTVIVDGRVLMLDRHLETLDKGQIIDQVNRTMERLARRSPAKRIQSYNP